MKNKDKLFIPKSKKTEEPGISNPALAPVKEEIKVEAQYLPQLTAIPRKESIDKPKLNSGSRIFKPKNPTQTQEPPKETSAVAA